MNLNATTEAMQHNNRWLVKALIIAGLQLSACQQKSDTPQKIEPATMEQSGKAIHRVRLTVRKAEEYKIKTAPIREEPVAGMSQKVIPAAAVVHDLQGEAWLFTSPDSLVFVRQRIRVEYITGELVALLEGPPAGTQVVVSGAQELFTIDF